MKIYLADNYINDESHSVALCLGQFDSIHVGHISLIERAKAFGDVFVYAFENSLSGFLFGKSGSVYTSAERKQILLDLGVSGVIFDEFNKSLMSLSGEQFLLRLWQTVKISAIVCGEDYRFGTQAKWNADDLKAMCKDKGIEVIKMPLTLFEGEKASTTRAKQLLSCGDVETLTRLLTRNYTITSVVTRGYQNGGKIGFKTANFSLPDDKSRVCEGVYIGYAIYKGNRYGAVINVGGRPTFNNDEYKIETNIDGFFPDLYGEELTVGFSKRLRDIKKFTTTEELKLQLQKDVSSMREYYGRYCKA